MKRYRNWIIALVVIITMGAIALQNRLVPSSVEVTKAPPITSTPTYEPCGYMWAYQDVPELAVKVESAIHVLNPEAKIRVQAFGENCVYADGRATFLAMETNIFINTTVKDLTDEDSLGNWMAQVLPLIIQISEDEFPGGYGVVEFWFEKSNGESIVVQVRIPKYFDAEVQAKSGVELFRLFYDKP